MDIPARMIFLAAFQTPPQWSRGRFSKDLWTDESTKHPAWWDLLQWNYTHPCQATSSREGKRNTDAGTKTSDSSLWCSVFYFDIGYIMILYWCCAVGGRNPAPVEVGSLSHYLDIIYRVLYIQVVSRIASINSMIWCWCMIPSFDFIRIWKSQICGGCPRKIFHA